MSFQRIASQLTCHIQSITIQLNIHWLKVFLGCFNGTLNHELAQYASI